MDGIQAIERSYRGDSFYYEVGGLAVVNRGKGIESVRIDTIVEYEDSFILYDERNEVILKIFDKDGVEIIY